MHSGQKKEIISKFEVYTLIKSKWKLKYGDKRMEQLSVSVMMCMNVSVCLVCVCVCLDNISAIR